MTAPPVLAQGRWLWRRVYVFATSGGAWLLFGRLRKRRPAHPADRPGTNCREPGTNCRVPNVVNKN